MLVFTDASFSAKPTMSGLGVVLLYNDKEVSFGTYIKDCRDNNVAELAAITLACQYIDKNNLPEKTITIISDSECALHRITYNAQGKDSFEQQCLDYIQDFCARRPKTRFMQVKGHIHDGTKLSYYNNEADIIAGEYRKMGLELERANPHKKKRKQNKSYYQSWVYKNHKSRK